MAYFEPVQKHLRNGRAVPSVQGDIETHVGATSVTCTRRSPRPEEELNHNPVHEPFSQYERPSTSRGISETVRESINLRRSDQFLNHGRVPSIVRPGDFSVDSQRENASHGVQTPSPRPSLSRMSREGAAENGSALNVDESDAGRTRVAQRLFTPPDIPENEMPPNDSTTDRRQRQRVPPSFPGVEREDLNPRSEAVSNQAGSRRQMIDSDDFLGRRFDHYENGREMKLSESAPAFHQQVFRDETVRRVASETAEKRYQPHQRPFVLQNERQAESATAAQIRDPRPYGGLVGEGQYECFADPALQSRFESRYPRSLPANRERNFIYGCGDFPSLPPVLPRSQEFYTPRIAVSSSDETTALEQYDGTTPWRTYLRHFELVAMMNEWDGRTRAMKLAASLTGKAQQALTGITWQTMQDYAALLRALRKRFEPAERVELIRVQLRARIQSPNESLFDLRDDIRYQVDYAYAGLPEAAKDAIALDYFLNAVADGEVRVQILKRGTCTLDQAVEYGAEIEAIQKAEKERDGRGPCARIRAAQTAENGTNRDEIMKMIREVLGEMKLLNQNQNRARDLEGVVCYECNGVGHYRRDCPTAPPRECYNCGSLEHLADRCPERRGQQEN